MIRTIRPLVLAGVGLALSAALVGCQPEEKPAETTTEATAAPAGEATPAADATTQGAAVDTAAGKAAYEANCASCHQANGEGVPGTFPPIAGAEQANGSADEHIKIVLKGLSGPIKVKGQDYNGAMPPFAHLSDADIAGIVTYERTAWGNTGGAVTADQVKALR